MNILISGSSGLVGSALIESLTKRGDTVTRLVRSKTVSDKRSVQWDPDSGQLDSAILEGMDIVIHLGGESIASGRWTPEQKIKIRDSRIKGTTLLSKTIAGMTKPPKVFLCASAIGIYGDRGDEVLDESSSPGSGFLVDVCREWEAATEAVEKTATRLVKLRFGVILSSNGGALAKMLTPFKMGVGGVVGSGKQFMSWITLDDAVNAILYAIATDSLKGPINVVGPNPANNHDFTKTLGHVLGRPTIFAMPAFAARLAFGQMGDELLLASQRVKPKKLADSGFTFKYPVLEDALRHLFNK